MTAKEYLQEYQSLRMQRQAYTKMLETFEQDAISIGGINYEEKVQKSPTNDPIGNMVIQLIQKKSQIGLKIAGIRAKEIIVENQILRMADINPEYCEIIIARYMNNYDWKTICACLGCSRAHANVLHGMALKAFSEQILGINQP